MERLLCSPLRSHRSITNAAHGNTGQDSPIGVEGGTINHAPPASGVAGQGHLSLHRGLRMPSGDCGILAIQAAWQGLGFSSAQVAVRKVGGGTS